MIFKQGNGKIIFRLILLAAMITGLAASIQQPQRIYLYSAAVIVFLQLIGLYRIFSGIKKEVDDFSESVHYRDFSRKYDIRHSPQQLQSLRKGFNTINDTFRTITREKETQYQYLQKILEMVDTAILSYDVETFSIGWMNDSFKSMFGIPYLKTIHSLEKKHPELYAAATSLRAHENKVVLVNKDQGTVKILVGASVFQTEGKVFKIIAFQNINEVLDENESVAWQKLLNVMTHEIMNSIAPISSLADTLNKRLQQPDEEDVAALFEDLKLGIGTIRTRSEGLLKFAETYRNLNRISTLNLGTVQVRSLFENLQRLMQPSLDQRQIEMDILMKETNLSFTIDSNLVEQALINLLVNAMEAVKDVKEPKLLLSAEASEHNKVTIKVTDNGTGISPEQMEKIFIPFYTSRKNGSGIGLSLCKQIMTMHKGTIRAQSVEGKGTVFVMQFG